MTRWIALAVLGLMLTGGAQTAPAQGTMGLLGVDSQNQQAPVVAAPATVPTSPETEPTWEERQALATAIARARDDLARARDRLKSITESLPSYAPGGYWDRHYRQEVADWTRSLAFAQEAVRRSRSPWARFKRFMNTDILTGEVIGSRDDWAADSSLRMTQDRLAQARGQVDRYIPEGYASMTAEKARLEAQIPQLEAALVPLEERRRAWNARGIRVLWDDLP